MNKHKENAYDEVPDTELNDCLFTLRDEIKSLSNKQQHLFCNWIRERSAFFKSEKVFVSGRFPSLSRGQVIIANFGYNIGSEWGGKRPAIVINNNQSKSSGTVVVVPVSTVDPLKSVANYPDYRVFLGEVFPGTGKQCFAAITAIREISKIRINNPKEHPITKISDETLDQIDEVIKKYFTKNNC